MGPYESWAIWRTRRRVRHLRYRIDAQWKFGLGYSISPINGIVIEDLWSRYWPDRLRFRQAANQWDERETCISMHSYVRERDRKRAFKRIDYHLIEELEKLLDMQ